MTVRDVFLRILGKTAAGNSVSVSGNGIIVTANVQTQMAGVNGPMQEQERCACNRNQKAVEDTVEDEFGVRRNDISTFTDTPADGIDHPKEADPAGDGEMDTLDVPAQCSGVLSWGPDEGVYSHNPHPEPEGVVTCQKGGRVSMKQGEFGVR